MNDKQRGFTLIELMISLVLGLAVMAGIMELFVQSQKVYKTQRAASYMMQDGRYVLEVLSKEIRRAGFLRNKSVNGGSATDVFREDLSVLNSSNVTPVIDLLEGDAVKGVTRDAVAFRYQLYDAQDLANVQDGNSPCTQNVGLDAGEDPAKNPHVVHVVSLYFYVQNDPDDPNNVPVLYCRAKREVITNTFHPITINLKKPDNGALPLISNVERLVVKYGVKNNNNTPEDSSDDFYYYTDADGVNNSWRDVIAIKLYVVLRSEEDNLMKNNVSYNIEGVTYTANDKRAYRVFSTTVTFRN